MRLAGTTFYDVRDFAYLDRIPCICLSEVFSMLISLHFLRQSQRLLFTGLFLLPPQ